MMRLNFAHRLSNGLHAVTVHSAKTNYGTREYCLPDMVHRVPACQKGMARAVRPTNSLVQGRRKLGQAQATDSCPLNKLRTLPNQGL